MTWEFFDETEELSRLEDTIELEPGVTLEHIGLRPKMIESELNTELGAGSPEKDAEHWHFQSEANSCAVACQEFVAEQLLQEDFSEQKMLDYAKEKGWYDSEVGTTGRDMGKLLESMGLEVERCFDLSLADLARELDAGAKPICGVNNMILAKPEIAAIPGQLANHAVEVIGIEQTAEGTRVILNDPGVEGGGGRAVSASTFLKAWQTGGNYAVIARKGALA